MTDAQFTTIIMAIPSTIGSIAAAIVAWKALRRTEENGLVAAKTGEKVNTVIDKAVEIHAVANSTHSQTVAALGVALAESKGLREVIASMTEAKVVSDRLAEKAADRAAVQLPTQPPPAIQSPAEVKIVNTTSERVLTSEEKP